MVVSQDDDHIPKPVVFVKNLPNGSPCLSALHLSSIHVNQDENIIHCHNVLLSNHEYNHGKINDIYVECLYIHKNKEASPLKLVKLKHCSVSFEKNLYMLDEDH